MSREQNKLISSNFVISTVIKSD